MVKLVEQQRAGRVMRHPEHTFQVRQNAWDIQPIYIAPVLPGETMRNLKFQMRAVSDPVLNKLVGWWAETYHFYVPHRALANKVDFEKMMLDHEYSLSALFTAADLETYHYASSIDWVQLCLDRVVAEFFRDENDVTPHTIAGGIPIASIARQSWLDSVINDAQFIADADEDVDGPDANTTIQASEVDRALRAWQFARAHSLTEMSYEDYLRTFGINVKSPDDDTRPELLRYTREWTYPTNTVEPTTGVPTSALSWALSDRADKDRFFQQPGFIFGVCVFRPKVYLSKQAGAAVSLLDNAFAWLPAIMRDDPYTSLRKVAALSGPLSLNTDAYWVDVRDLFLYGDQFVNYALTDPNSNFVALPTAGLEKRYATMADNNALFSGTNRKIRSDGIVTLAIAGTLKDQTPPINRLGI